jgi:hypothetical protein
MYYLDKNKNIKNFIKRIKNSKFYFLISEFYIIYFLTILIFIDPRIPNIRKKQKNQKILK